MTINRTIAADIKNAAKEYWRIWGKRPRMIKLTKHDYDILISELRPLLRANAEGVDEGTYFEGILVIVSNKSELI